MQEVSGSIPLGSTNFRPSRAVNFLKNRWWRKLAEPSAEQRASVSVARAARVPRSRASAPWGGRRATSPLHRHPRVCDLCQI